MPKTQTYQKTWVGLLEVRDRRVLMTREFGHTRFQLPGGEQEKNESEVETLRREVREELAVELINIAPYDDFILPGKNEGVLIRFVVYTADIVGGMQRGNDIEEIRWVNSMYRQEHLEIGNPTQLRLFPRLYEENLID